MPCEICGEKDESRLMLRTEFVNGRVEHSEVCLSCFWFRNFRTEGENGIHKSKELQTKKETC